jgi:type II secretory pathway component PulM
MIFAACAAFTLAVLVYVFWVPGNMESTPEKTRLVYLRERKDAVYENLRDLNFEYKAGKLPETDYQSMKSALEEEAAALLSEIAALEEYPGASYVVSPARGKEGARV